MQQVQEATQRRVHAGTQGVLRRSNCKIVSPL
jgi:hypothetical protein